MSDIKSLFPENDQITKIITKISKIADKTKTETYLVGGVIRDRLLGRDTTDIDITVIGSGIEFAEQLAAHLDIKRVVKYEKFGTALLPYNNFTIEVATARSEKYEDDSRKPEVEIGNLEDDLKRRDFTINALAMPLNSGNMYQLIDFYNGLQDLNNGIIKTPLDPIETFSEDPLRMLRAIRFATQLGFYIDDLTFHSISEVKERIKIISQERITEELVKIIMTRRKPSQGFYLLDKCGLLEIILPDIDKMKGVDQKGEYHHKDVFYHTMQVLDNVAEESRSFKLRFTALVHDIAKPQTKEFVKGKGWTFHGHELLGPEMIKRLCKQMKLPNKVRDYAIKLTRLHLRPIALAKEGVTDSAVRRLLVEIEDDLDDLMILCKADITSSNPDRVQRYLNNFKRVEKRIEEVKERDKLRKFQSPVRGDEIMDYFDLDPGPAIGYIKSKIENAILDGDIPNDHQAAYQYMVKHADDFREKIIKKFK
ncbi:MAG: CCA tRNA nucleotidyltransferase [Candidatus Marinimicrobia bacterium]|nr:CCA tRNA nucleotidyltransferase [Candidatus Neomarinimicrobiota bacterium]